MIEIISRPNNYDVEWSPTAGDGAIAGLYNKRSCLASGTFGIPTQSGMRYRMVNVIEWLPAAGTGLVAQPAYQRTSTATFADVVDYLDQAGDWMYKGAVKVGHAASSIYAGVSAVKHIGYGLAKMAPLIAA
jgi:hypothetical protein